MNEKQRRVVVGAAGMVALMFLFPPFAIRGFSLGYHFILSRHGGASVNVALLLTQWLGVAAIATVAWFLLRDPQR